LAKENFNIKINLFMTANFLMEFIRAKESIHIMSNIMMENGKMDVKMDSELKSKKTSMSIQGGLKIIKETEKEFYILLHKK
jgi:hypothetical protein